MHVHGNRSILDTMLNLHLTNYYPKILIAKM